MIRRQKGFSRLSAAQEREIARIKRGSKSLEVTDCSPRKPFTLGTIAIKRPLMHGRFSDFMQIALENVAKKEESSKNLMNQVGVSIMSPSTFRLIVDRVESLTEDSVYQDASDFVHGPHSVIGARVERVDLFSNMKMHKGEKVPMHFVVVRFDPMANRSILDEQGRLYQSIGADVFRPGVNQTPHLTIYASRDRILANGVKTSMQENISSYIGERFLMFAQPQLTRK